MQQMVTYVRASIEIEQFIKITVLNVIFISSLNILKILVILQIPPVPASLGY